MELFVWKRKLKEGVLKFNNILLEKVKLSDENIQLWKRPLHDFSPLFLENKKTKHLPTDRHMKHENRVVTKNLSITANIVIRHIFTYKWGSKINILCGSFCKEILRERWLPKLDSLLPDDMRLKMGHVTSFLTLAHKFVMLLQFQNIVWRYADDSFCQQKVRI